MGRITDLRQRVVVLVAYAVLHVLLVPAEGALVTGAGAPVVSLTTGLLVTVLLTLGPTAATVAVVVRLLPLLQGGEPALVAADVLVVGTWVAVVLLVERTFRHFGPVRTWRPMASFLVGTVVLGPALLVLVELLVAGTPVTAGRWLGVAIGAAGLAPGLRVVVLAPSHGHLVERRALLACLAFVAAVVATSLLRPGEEGAGVTLFALLLLLGGIGGYGAFVLATAGAALALPVLLEVLASDAAARVVDPGAQFGWVVGIVCGLLLAIERDRRDDLASDLRAVFDGAATPTLVVRLADLAVESANPAMVELVGADALEGPAFLDHIHPEDRFPVAPEQVARKALEMGHGQMRLRAASGEWRQARWSARRIPRTGRDRDAVLFQLVDVSQLHERSTALTRSNEALSRVAGRVSHDLKQPLSSISGYAETLREHAPRLEPEQVQLMAGRLHDAALRATGYLDDLVQDARELGGEPRPVDVAAVLEQVEATLAIDLEDGVHPIERRLLVPTVHARRGTVLAVLSNLVGNALKYGEGAITVSTRRLAGGVRLTVEDEGTGIPVAELGRVFGRGVRLQAAGDGTGAGLGEVRDRVEALGGRVRAVPMASGARVDVWFPGPDGGEVPPHVSVLVAVGARADADLLRSLLELDDAVEHVGHVQRGDELADACALVRPDLLLLQRELVDGDALRHVGAVVEVAPATQVVLYEPDTTGPAMDSLAAAVRRHGAAAGLTADEVDEQLSARLREMRRD